MTGIEDEGLELDGDALGADDDDVSAPDRASTGGFTSHNQAIRNLQRARKALTSEGNATGLSDYLMKSATVWAILELADAIRSSRQSS